MGLVVGSPGWKVKCASKVDRFRQSLSPEEAELFNECLMQICRNPEVDNIHKFKLPASTPVETILYRDNNFVLVYYPSRITRPFPVHMIEVFKATRVRDLDEGKSHV